MSVEENKALIRRLYDEVWNKGNLSLIPDLVSPAYRYADRRGPEGYKEIVLRQLVPFPDLHCTIDELVGEDDTLVALVTRTGTFEGRLGDMEPTGNRASITEVLFYRFADGKLVQTKGYYDRLSFFQQLGIAPPGFEVAKK